MDVHLTRGELRLHISRAELDQLRVGRSIELEVALPRRSALRATVTTAAIGDWQLDSDPTGLWLAVPRGVLETFSTESAAPATLARSFDIEGGRSVTVILAVDANT